MSVSGDQDSRYRAIAEREILAYGNDHLKAINAPRVAAVLRGVLPFGSVIDMGCGSGVYLREFQKLCPATGVDGNPDVHPPVLADLAQPQDFRCRYDLVFSIEVAEHIEPEGADTFIGNLVRHCAKWVVMTACPPGRYEEVSEYNAVAHQNEQPREYWMRLLEHYGMRIRDDLAGRIQARLRASDKPILNPRGAVLQHGIESWFVEDIICADFSFTPEPATTG